MSFLYMFINYLVMIYTVNCSYSSVVERAIADRAVPCSNQGVSFDFTILFCYLFIPKLLSFFDLGSVVSDFWRGVYTFIS